MLAVDRSSHCWTSMRDSPSSSIPIVPAKLGQSLDVCTCSDLQTCTLGSQSQCRVSQSVGSDSGQVS